ncbi:cell division protein ZapA [Rhodopseudomonas sp. P2A-2r]|uniref:cell division protein ZapA n=1 Tax=Rhodopseudomonas sp. P2A-2r TaxID=2991972 RepID=UPI002234642D|nr:cell division protein ZapA [Rhodopseudomonas sp. P2A-2r]UZE51084.1 cell division protein ZapA [Rhodopseudomonas sp. P2A-2r]
MGHIKANINGREYRMACEEGQEARLENLLHKPQARMAKLSNKFGKMGDPKLTVMAALTAIDELDDANLLVSQLRNRKTSARSGQPAWGEGKPDEGKRADGLRFDISAVALP